MKKKSDSLPLFLEIMLNEANEYNKKRKKGEPGYLDARYLNGPTLSLNKLKELSDGK